MAIEEHVSFSGSANALQQAMLPAHLPADGRVEFSSAYRPAESESEVGGDWYDAFTLPSGKIAISIGDVGGHGLAATVAMSEARQALRLSGLEGISPADSLVRLNHLVALNSTVPLITAVFGLIDVERSRFTYSCAGHPPPILATLEGHVRFLYGGGIPIGIDRRAAFPTWEVRLEPFATLMLYTDGLIEFNRDIERENRRLLDAIRNNVHDMAPDGAEAIVSHMLDGPQVDDIALLLATILPSRPGRFEIRLPSVPFSAAVARRFAGRFARAASLSPERTFSLTLAVGEAVANAVEHAYGERRGLFALSLSMRGETVFGEVRDAGAWRTGSESADRGRGLSIMGSITNRLTVNRSAMGTAIAFEV